MVSHFILIVEAACGEKDRQRIREREGAIRVKEMDTVRKMKRRQRATVWDIAND